MVNHKRNKYTKKKRSDIIKDVQQTEYKLYNCVKKLSNRFLSHLKSNNNKNNNNFLGQLCTKEFKQACDNHRDTYIEYVISRLKPDLKEPELGLKEPDPDLKEHEPDLKEPELGLKEPEPDLKEPEPDLKEFDPNKIVNSSYENIIYKLNKQYGSLHLFNEIICKDPIILVSEQSCKLNSNMTYIDCVVERVYDNIIRSLISSNTEFKDLLIILEGCIFNKCVFRNCRVYFIGCVVLNCDISSTTFVSEDSTFINH